jgi:phosphatidylinositol kinase/protein kinase (PI-3  family)
VRRLVQRILTEVGRGHPQALVYALTVASKYPSAPRRKAALAILDKMRDHSATLVDQAVLVSQELMRVAVLWHEMWHECLEEASRQYFGEHNIEAMFATLEPMHELLERVSAIFLLMLRLSLDRARKRSERLPLSRCTVAILWTPGNHVDASEHTARLPT